MKKDEIRVGGIYEARVAGRYTTVRVDAIRQVTGWSSPTSSRATRMETVYDVTNLTTKRKTTFRSAAKFRREAPLERASKPHPQPATLPESITLYQRTDDPASKTMIQHPAQIELPTDEQLSQERASIEAEHLDEYYDEDLEQWVKLEGEQRSDPTRVVPATTVREDGARATASENHSAPNPTTIATSAASPSTATASAVSAAPNATVHAQVAPTNSIATKIGARIIAASTRTALPAGVTLTEEQEVALQAVLEVEAVRGRGQRVLVLKAGAGSGKTFELQQMEQVLPGNGQYTAYNASLVKDSKPKFRRAACNTTHSLAFRAVGHKYKHRLDSKRMRSYEIAQRLGISDFIVDLPEAIAPADVDANGNKIPQTRRLKAAWLAGQATEAVRRFCQSADAVIDERHISKINGLDPKGSYDNSDRVKEYLLPFVQKLWADIVEPEGTLPFSHDCYVKIWEMGRGDDRPVIAADFIMLDEYQDTAPVMVSILKQQTHAVLVLVGDDNQRIYEWRGAINAGDEFPDAPRCNLSKSFRFGQAVADVANSVLAGLEEPTDLVMKGFEKIPTRICQVKEPRCYLYRTNAGAIGKLMHAMDSGKRGHLIGGSAEVVSFCKAALALQNGEGTEHAQLGCFTKWSEVQEYSKEDEGADLRLMVKLIDDFRADRIIQALESMPDEKDADLVISTAHRSKGREWTSVKLGQDFPLPNKMGDAERRLVYVAATRAQEELDISECPTFCGGWDKTSGGEDGEGGEPRWIPGIEVHYTTEMPTAEELEAYRAAKRASKAAAAPVPAPATTPTAAPIAPGRANSAPANGNGGGFSWASMDGKWLVRGPKDQPIGSQVKVVRKDGSSAMVMLGKVEKKIGDLWFYAVQR